MQKYNVAKSIKNDFNFQAILISQCTQTFIMPALIKYTYFGLINNISILKKSINWNIDKKKSVVTVSCQNYL